MVRRFGMGRGLGARVFGSEATQPFMVRARSRPPEYSQQTARDIDSEIGVLARTPVSDDGRVLRLRPRGPRLTEAAEAI